MTFSELAAHRRSVRKYLNREVDRTTIENILRDTLTAPSSKNTRTTRIAVTADRQILERIARMRSYGSAFVKDAPLAFIVMADPAATDLWRINCAISATILQLSAASYGLGSCWVQVDGRPHQEDNPNGTTAEEYLHEMIPATQPYRILCVVAAGYPETEPKPHSPKDDSDKVIFL